MSSSVPFVPDFIKKEQEEKVIVEEVSSKDEPLDNYNKLIRIGEVIRHKMDSQQFRQSLNEIRKILDS